MRATPQKAQASHRRGDKGAVLVVVLLVMMALLGMGLAGLYLTSGTIQMNANINMRNQALYMAEAGINRARSVLNRPATPSWQPDLAGMLEGTKSPNGMSVPTLALTHEIPDPSVGCLAESGTGRGAYFRDEPGTVVGCDGGGGSAYIDCRLPDPASQLGKYTLFIRQDLAECRLGGNLPKCETNTDPTKLAVCTDASGNVVNTNSIVVVRSEGTASDNRTRVVLEVTMVRNFNAPVVNTNLATVCPAGQSGCDDNSSVQQGIVVSGALTPPPAGAGASGTNSASGSGAGGASGGAGGASSTTPLGGTTVVASSSASSGGTSGSSSSGCSTGPCCPTGQAWCGTACCDGTCVSDTCCPKSNTCNNIAIVGEYGIWGENGQFVQWLSTHSSSCNSVTTLPVETDPTNSNNWTKHLSDYGILIVLDLFHKAGEFTGQYPPYQNSGSQRPLSNDEVNAVTNWVKSGRGLMTTVGVSDVTAELTNPNMLLAPFNIQYDPNQTKGFLKGTGKSPNRLNCWISGGLSTCNWRWVSAPLSMWNVDNLQVDNGWALRSLAWGPVVLAEPLANTTAYLKGKLGMILDNQTNVFGSPAKKGRVVAWGDEWLTYNHDWTPTTECPAKPNPGTPYWKTNLNSCTQTFWNNIISWLRASCVEP
jgi:hypothetical protein